MTTPDRKQGRGLQLQANPVKKFCVEHSISVWDPEKLKDSSAEIEVGNLKPDLFVVASYGKMIPSSWLSIPTLFPLNVHPSLLPKYRGAAPIQWPILNGDEETGASIAIVTPKLDAGDILWQEHYPLSSKINSAFLFEELAKLSGQCLEKVFHAIESHTLNPQSQNESQSCYARKLSKEDGFFTFQETAENISRKIRGLQPWPLAYSLYDKTSIQIIEGEAVPESDSAKKAGTLISYEKEGSCLIQTGKGVLKLSRLKPAGKKEMPAGDFFRGKRLRPGDIIELERI